MCSNCERLAVEGGTKVRTRSFAPWPWYESDEIAAAVEVLKSGRINYHTGSEGRCFEEEFAAATESKYAVGVANGTVALELALRAVDVGEGDEVIVPCRTFVASASCVVMRRATPIFADVSEKSGTLTAHTVEQAIGKRTKAIIAVHLAGWPCEMDDINALARRHSLRVIEDCAQAQGARYRGHPVGCFGDAAAFSFCQDKIMSTGGEGGMLVTSDEEIWRKAWSYKDHGKSVEILRGAERGHQFLWVHNSIGTNWRLTEMQSAIGRRLLAKLPTYIEKRRNNANYLTKLLKELPGIRLTIPPAHVHHSYYKYYAFLQPQLLRSDWSRNDVLTAINAEGIPCSSGGCSEIYLEKAFPANSKPARPLPVARRLGQTSLMFLVHPTLNTEDMNDTYLAIRKVLAKATYDCDEVELQVANRS